MNSVVAWDVMIPTLGKRGYIPKSVYKYLSTFLKITNPTIGKFFVDQFAGKSGKEGGEGLFKKFVKMAKPGVVGVKNALDAAPFKIGPLDIIVDATIDIQLHIHWKKS